MTVIAVSRFHNFSRYIKPVILSLSHQDVLISLFAHVLISPLSLFFMNSHQWISFRIKFVCNGVKCPFKLMSNAALMPVQKSVLSCDMNDQPNKEHFSSFFYTDFILLNSFFFTSDIKIIVILLLLLHIHGKWQMFIAFGFFSHRVSLSIG